MRCHYWKKIDDGPVCLLYTICMQWNWIHIDTFIYILYTLEFDTLIYVCTTLVLPKHLRGKVIYCMYDTHITKTPQGKVVNLSRIAVKSLTASPDHMADTATLRKLYFLFLSYWMGYDRSDSFPLDLEPNGIHLAQNRKENCHYDHIPFNMKGIGNIVFPV